MTDKSGSMPPKRIWKSAAVAFIALSIVLAGALAFEYSGYSSLSSKYKSLEAAYSSEVSSYNTLQSTTASKISQLNSSSNSYGIMALAYSHWNAIASLNVTATAADYSSGAVLYWVGGALNGTYSGSANISSVWLKFFHSAGAAWWSGVSPLSIKTIADSAYVNETIQFTITSASNPLDISSVIVSYTLQFTYSNGHWSINSEIWKLAGHQIESVGNVQCLKICRIGRRYQRKLYGCCNLRDVTVYSD